MPSPNDERWGNYLLESRIGSGGMAEVFRARRLGSASFTRHVCVKRMHPHLCEDPSFVDMFLDEARTGSKLRHPNIVATEDLGEHEGRYFLALEYVHGVDLWTLEERLRARNERIAPEVGAFVAEKVLSALDAAHRAIDPDDGTPLHVVHRDVSPRNVLVSFSGEVKLTDFGIARAAKRTRKTQTGVVRGHFGYMPPEQATAAAVDVRADLYALGVTLFELLAGKRPFAGDDPDAPIEAIVLAQSQDRRPTLASLRSDLGEAFCAFVERLFARDVGARPRDAAEALELLLALPESRGGGLALAKMMSRLFPSESSVAAHGSVTPPTPTPVREDGINPYANTEASASRTPTSPAASDVSRPERSSLTGTLRSVLVVLAAASVGAVGMVALTLARTRSEARRHDAPIARSVAPNPTAASTAVVLSPTSHEAAPLPSIPAPTANTVPEPVHSVPDHTAPVTVASHRRGTLRVVAFPWGHVSIDGHPRGDSPVTLSLESGMHTVVVTGGVDYTERVQITPGGVRVVRAGAAP